MKISAKLPLSQPPYTLQTSFEFLENILDFHHQKDQPLPPARDQNRWGEENERRRMFWGLRVWLDTCEFFINHDNINVPMQETPSVSFFKHLGPNLTFFLQTSSAKGPREYKLVFHPPIQTILREKDSSKW